MSEEGALVAVCTTHAVRTDPGRVGRTGIDRRAHQRVEVTAGGLHGDVICDAVHHGGRDKAVYAYDQAEAARWADELGVPVPHGWFGENLRVAGLAVTDAVIGEQWRVGEQVVLQVTMPRTPCATFGRWVQQPHWVRRFTERADVGAYLRVLHPGTLRPGDAIRVTDRPAHGATVRDVFTGAHPERLTALRAAGVDVAAPVLAAVRAVLARV